MDSIFHLICNNHDVPASEKAPERLEREATLLMMAGTESTAKSLTIAHFYLLHNPSMLQSLDKELAANPSSSLTDLQRLPYLSAVIQEANRLSFGMTSRNSRIAPNEALECNGCVIPAGTPMSITSLAVYANERLFPDPWAFKPERWLEHQGVRLKKYQMAFGKGMRRCIGINLAQAELSMVLAEVMKCFDLELFETTEDDVKFLHDYHVAHPKLDSKGVRCTLSQPHK